MKLKSKKGFTLMEMLIVVAIIGILAAIAIPVFNGALENSKKAADDANFRAAKASSAVEYLSKQYGKETDSTVVVKDSFFTTDGTWAKTGANIYKGQAAGATKGQAIKGDDAGGVAWATAPTT